MHDRMLRSHCKGGCSYECNVSRWQSGGDEAHHVVYTERFVIHETENIHRSNWRNTATAAIVSRSRNFRAWPYLVGIPVWLMLFLPLLTSPATHSYVADRAIFSYVFPSASAEVMNRTMEVIQIKKFYHFFSPPLKLTHTQDQQTDASADKFMEQIASMQHRLEAVDKSVQARSQGQTTESFVSLQSEINELRSLYDALLQRMDDLANSYAKNDEDGNEVTQLKASMATVKEKLKETARDQTLWRQKFQELVSASARAQQDLNELRTRVDSAPAPAVKDCSKTQFTQDYVSKDELNSLVAAALTKYDADKTGMADFALQSAGGSILGVRCTETYSPLSRQEVMFGLPLWYQSYLPDTVIQAGGAPGECWAFKGSHGYLVIKLAGVIRISGFSYEHISKSISPTGNIDSAPKIFAVNALASEKDEEGLLLGNYKYDDSGSSLQYFPVQVEDAPPTEIVELRILSNHGHPVYTCLYRFRVHGERVGPAYGKEL